MKTRFVPEGRLPPPLLLNPGPSNVTASVARALLLGDMCHREPEFAQVQTSIRALLLQAFAPGAEERYTSVLLTGSGTAALEATITSVVGPNQTLLVLENGVYGERITTIASAYGIRHMTSSIPWTEPHDPAELARLLADSPEIDVVACVHHETTTGLLNPLKEIAGVCNAAGKLLLVDAISSLAGEELDLVGWGVDACVATANKCIRGIAGLSFTLLRRQLMERIAGYPPRTLYLNLPTYHAKQEAGGTPFTPAVQVSYALEQALRELLDEGLQNRIVCLRRLAKCLRDGFSRLGLQRLLNSEQLSNTVTTLLLPDGWSYESLHDSLKAEGFVIYAGQGALKEHAFRVANMGVMDEHDAERLHLALERVLKARDDGEAG